MRHINVLSKVHFVTFPEYFTYEPYLYRDQRTKGKKKVNKKVNFLPPFNISSNEIGI